MGCGSSKAAKNVVAPAEFSPKNVNIVDVSQRKASDPIVDDEMKSKHRKLSRDSLKDSCGSSKSSREDIRKNSSSLQDTSKSVQRGQSAKSNDSGLGDYDDEKQIITEETKLNEKGVKELEIRPATPGN